MRLESISLLMHRCCLLTQVSACWVSVNTIWLRYKWRQWHTNQNNEPLLLVAFAHLHHNWNNDFLARVTSNSVSTEKWEMNNLISLWFKAIHMQNVPHVWIAVAKRNAKKKKKTTERSSYHNDAWIFLFTHSINRLWTIINIICCLLSCVKCHLLESHSFSNFIKIFCFLHSMHSFSTINVAVALNI